MQQQCLYTTVVLARSADLYLTTAISSPPPNPQPHSSIVDQSSARDIKEARVFENYQLPKLYIKQYYSVEAAVHQRLVRSRSKDDRRNRAPPERKRPGQR